MLIIVIVVVVVVVVPVVLAAVLYVLVSGLIQGPNSPPIVAFGFVDQTGGNATIDVSSSREIDPSSLQVRLSANSSGSSTGMPPPGGSVALIVGGYTLRMFWLDEDNDRVFGTGDAFRVTGNSAPLPSSTVFSLEISLVTSSGQMTSGVTWTST